HFPHPYYSLRLSLPGTNASARLLLLDTVLLCGGGSDSDVGYRDRDDGYRDSDNGYRDRDDGYRDSDDGYRDRDDGYRDSDDGYRDRDDRYRDRDDRYRDRDDSYRDRDDSYRDRDGYRDSGGSAALQRGQPRERAAAEAQLAWLQRRLVAAERDRFVLVAGHYPLWSAGEHGPSACLRRLVRPLLRRHRVSAYICGHDHNVQFLWEGGVGYVVSGAGNFMEGSRRHEGALPPGSLRFFYGAPASPGAFAHIRLEPHAATVTFLEATGRLLHREVLPPRHR
ncbi:tartrate-resistant acid phosphatase type 5, partial [Pezoporus wallicus]|uniref:tartrate-resistant acid phosphatase type 5 n=1 Tax=Pezoporus wallicus TaxID=35540 RepID=UPI00254C48A3